MQNDLETVQQLAYTVNDIPLISPGFLFEIFIDLTTGQEVLDFYEHVRTLLGERLTHYDTGSGSYKALNKRAETLVPTWCGNPVPWSKRGFYTMIMSGHKEGETAAGLRIDFLYRTESVPATLEAWLKPVGRKFYNYSSLSCFIPLNHPLVLSGEIVGWLCRLMLVARCRFISGSCGIGLNFPYNSPQSLPYEQGKITRNRVAALVLRHPGFDLREMELSIGIKLMQYDRDYAEEVQAPVARPYLKRANWLSFLGERQVELLGGAARLQAAFADEPEIKLHPLRHGLCIQAGAWPQIGDVVEEDRIPLYQKVAKVLRPIRLQELRVSWSYSDYFNDVGSNEWLNAFDRP
jgi:hypothetical protein